MLQKIKASEINSKKITVDGPKFINTVFEILNFLMTMKTKISTLHIKLFTCSD